MSVLVLHADAAARDALIAALKERGVEAHGAPDVDAALDVADRVPIKVALADPEILAAEPLDIPARLSVRTGSPVVLYALTHLADPARKKAFAVHSAQLLPRPVEDLDVLALTLIGTIKKAALPPKPEPTFAKVKVERVAPLPSEELGAPARPDGKPTIALVVDDDETLRQMMADLLSPRGYVVEAFASVDGALRFLGKRGAEVSVILSDLQLPRGDGFEFKSSLTGPAASVPFFIVTGHATHETNEIAKKVGVTAVIPKPMNARALLQQVRAAILAQPS